MAPAGFTPLLSRRVFREKYYNDSGSINRSISNVLGGKHFLSYLILAATY